MGRNEPGWTRLNMVEFLLRGSKRLGLFLQVILVVLLMFQVGCDCSSQSGFCWSGSCDDSDVGGGGDDDDDDDDDGIPSEAGA